MVPIKNSAIRESSPMVNDLIVFGEDWGALPSSTQHLIKQLLKNRKVVWINSIGLRAPKLSFNDIKRAWKKLTSSSKSSHNSQANNELPNNLTVIYPKTIPVPKSGLTRKLARYLLKKQILKVTTPLGLSNPILWTSLPTAVDMIGHLNEYKSLYYCGDDFSALAGVDHKTVAKRESELVQKVDLILTASETLKQKFPPNKTSTLTHGVDYELFSELTHKAKDLPDNNRPIAGFYGSISEWFDIELMYQTIQKMPEWDFVLVGKTEINTEKLSTLKNVYFLGSKPHQQLPQYSQHWQVSLLPFVDNEQIRACNPLKLKEYLASGTPIVSTYFNAIEEYKDFISVISSAEEMVMAIEQAKNQKNSDKMRAAVYLESWQAKSEQVAKHIQSLSDE